MKKCYTELREIKLVGVSVRTNNKNEFDPAKAKIASTVEKYFAKNTSGKILTRKNPGVVYSCYTDYESDMKGDYTYFLGEEVQDFTEQSIELDKLIIPQQGYIKFTSSPGKMPDVCINMWKSIWQMSIEDLGGKRSYKTDFELYDKRSEDKSNTVLDIYIGIQRLT